TTLHENRYTRVSGDHLPAINVRGCSRHISVWMDDVGTSQAPPQLPTAAPARNGRRCKHRLWCFDSTYQFIGFPSDTGHARRVQVIGQTSSDVDSRTSFSSSIHRPAI